MIKPLTDFEIEELRKLIEDHEPKEPVEYEYNYKGATARLTRELTPAELMDWMRRIDG